LFGWRRDGRKLGGEVDVVLSQVPQKAWLLTRKPLSFDSLPDSTVVIHNKSDNSKLCGEYLIQIQDRLPWAWAKSRDKTVMPSKVAHVRVVCE
jgi:hypothetical protein